MTSKWPPNRDADLATYVAAVAAKLTASPTTYALAPADAAQFATASTAFVNAYAAAIDPATRTKAAVSQKDVARANILRLLRADAKRIQASPAVTMAAKLDLGLPIHDAKPTPVPLPAVAPQLVIVSAVANTVRIRLEDAAVPSRRGKPHFVAGAAVYSFVGDAPPASLSA
jgi:hypothetical protein